MRKFLIALSALVVVLALAVGLRTGRQRVAHPKPMLPDTLTSTGSADEAHPSFIYGRVNTVEGGVYEGRLRFGSQEEAFWGNYFNGVRMENPWAAQVPPDRLPRERQPIEIFGLEIASKQQPMDLSRIFMARFGDIARIEGHAREVHITLKSGTKWRLNRFSASDFDDGVRVWDRRGVTDIDTLRIRTIEFLPISRIGVEPAQLHGTVHTKHGKFTGFVQWDREESMGSDELPLRTSDGEIKVRFDTIRSIVRRSRDNTVVTLRDGREIVLSGKAGKGNRGVYVDDPRYGRVLVSWTAFDSIDFHPGDSGPDYDSFPPGGPITGTVTTRAGKRFAGRLVYDLDESEITETLDAPSHGVDYTMPFGLIASIVLPESPGQPTQLAKVTLHSGEAMQLECTGDLGERNGGLLIFVDGHQNPEYVSWIDVSQVELDRPKAMYPPLPSN